MKDTIYVMLHELFLMGTKRIYDKDKGNLFARKNNGQHQLVIFDDGLCKTLKPGTRKAYVDLCRGILTQNESLIR